ncbi:uncharacterized protein LOC122534404 isoform X1 [Frieseomelitta varia]|uniref:uncharacterized protein LOC122534404 isoform X1 n=1 Tax=Frieseomelitta varia TaxID=561572 RepID=UPI001CB6A46B|nr:uncharacterized protein LOC122534404 isoform X1 [Frieseomelitta varia]
MIVRRCLTLTVAICLILSVKFDAAEAERWSRQVSNSEWIPLANPRASQAQVEQNNPAAGLLAAGNAQLPQLPQLSLPPALQQQYQEQLLQLQKTQENIQKLLLLQQQLRAQQQLLQRSLFPQSQTFLPSGFSNADEDKQLHDVGLGGSQMADVSSEDLVPPLPASEALPPVFPAQNFLGQRSRHHPPTKQDASLPQEVSFVSLSGQDFKNGQLLQPGEQNVGNVGQIEENQRQGAKQIKEPGQAPLVPQGESGQNEEEEVQLVYVPAETLAQRGQPKRGRGRKQYPLRQQQQQQPQQPQQHHDSRGIDDQDALARQILQQIQLEREEKAQFLKEERMKEIVRLNEEQKSLERKARLQQEALQREQELQRQREIEKKKKELEKLEELAKQRELERIREAREKQRVEELERRRLAEIRAKEEKRRAEEAAGQREIERLAALEKQKELEFLREREKQRENEARLAGPERTENQDVQAQALPFRDQFHRQHPSDTPKQSKSKVRGRQRQRVHYQDQQNYRETTTPSPNQPPLAVYMGSSSTKTSNVKVADVLRILKDAKTIAVLDTVGPDTPQVFVGPTSLDPPTGYAKFDLPYLSSIDHNRVERKVDKLPFFVAPLSFDPPPGYSKIPFPAPHIGSVVVNTLDNADPKGSDDHNPSPTPLIEPNSYLDGLDSVSESTTPSYEPQTTINYSPESSSTPRYEQTYAPTSSAGYSGSRFRFRQFYGDGKPASVVTSYYDDQRSTTRKQKYYDESSSRTTEAPVQSPKVETSVSRAEDISYSTTPSFREETIGQQEESGQLALINQQLAQQRVKQRYNNGGQYSQQNPQASAGLVGSFDGEITAGDVNDVRAPVGPTQYSLPAELPAISPHLPGLVNSLLDKNEVKLHPAATTTTSTTTTTTTTTTTQRTPTTTYRPRSRQRSRLVPTRPRTTTEAPSTKSNVDKNRRPYNRSRSRFTTTTEEYRESAYEPTKSKIPETTLRYNSEHRRPTSRTNKYRNRDKTSQQSEVVGHAQNLQAQQPGYDAGPSISDSNSPITDSGSSVLHQLDSSSSLNDHAPENYPPTTVSATENYPSFHDVTVNHATALISDDYSRSQNYPQNVQDPRYRPGYDESTLERTDIEKNPVNGFNYQAQSGESLDQEVVQRPKSYQLDGKAENSDFELATTVDPRLRTPEEQRYSQIYEVNVPQNQPEYSLTGQDNLHRVESDKIQAGVDEDNPNERPIFIPLPENKQEDYELPVSPTEIPLSDITTEAITTSTTPVVIRQRVRGRVGTRLHHEPSVQTRNKGSQDEYVRFNVVNQDSTRIVPSRQRARTRPRTQNLSHGSQVQTDGNEYIKIHAVQQQRQIVAATKPPAPSTTTTTVRPTEEDIDYGFIRPPNFRPAHPVDNRFQTPVTYRPQLSEVPQQSLLANDETAVESNPPQAHLPKNRQKYQPAPNRRLPLKPTTLPPLTTTPEIVTTTERIPVATVLPEDMTYTGRPKSRPDETKQTRIRGRIRRPGRKRVTTTSTTESVLEAHNELPLDENYPLIRPQSVTAEQQQSPYDDNYDNAGGFLDGARNPTSEHQFYDASSENYPPEFILNFGNYPAQPVQREEYDQTQLASSSAKKYSQASRTRPSEDDRQTTADIYGSESQWSTKLTRTSFQPSFAVNQVPEEAPKSNQRFHESLKNANPPEIITAAPEVSSVTLVVSSDDRNTQREENETMLMGTTIFGRKTVVQDHTEKLNTSETSTTAPEAKEKSNSEADVGQNGDPWLEDKVKDSTEQQNIDLEKIVKKNDNSTSPVGKRTTRRRRVRVRVRPAVDDFVTAESQHLNSALNGLFRGQYKYNPVRESKPSAVGSTSPGKSILQDFLSDILKSGESTKITTTEVPEVAWTMSPAATTPMVIPGDIDETTEIQITTIPYTYSIEETTITVSPEDLFTKLKPRDDTRANEQEKKERNEKKPASVEKETWESTKKRSQKTTINFGSITDKYKTSGNDASKSNGELNDSEAPRGIDQKESEGKNDVAEDGSEIDKESASEFEERNKESMDENSNHPKNHRAKWSEVRYPFAFDHSKPSSWNYDPKTSGRSATTSIPGFVTRNEGDNSVKTLSDYVQAIFDTMKSAEEETTVANTENPDEIATTVLPVFNTEIPDRVNRSREEKSAIDGGAFKLNDDEVETTTWVSFEESETTTNLYENGKEATSDTESTTDVPLKNVTTLERIKTTPHATTNPSSEDYSATDPLLTTTPKPSSTALLTNSTESILGKVLRTSTTTKVSHMTEICYRGRCVMTRPSRDDRLR